MLSSTANRAAYAGNGVTVSFAFPYKFNAAADLKVLLVDEFEGEFELDLGSDFTVSGALSDSGGSVVLAIAPTGTQRVVIIRDPLLIQDLDLVDNGSLRPEELEKRLDKITMALQRMKELALRALRLPDGSNSEIDLSLPEELIPGRTLKVSEDGLSIEMGPNAEDVASAQDAAIAAQVAAESAVASETAAAGYATGAAASATSAAASATSAGNSATNAAAHESNAGIYMSGASNYANTAQNHAQTAGSAASAAGGSANNASISETNAANSKTAAETAATNAGNSATAAANSATSAATSAGDLAPNIIGTRAAPQSLTAATVPFTGTKWFNTMFIQGSGGAVSLSGTPRIQAGTNVGQCLTVIGRSDTNTVTLPDGQGVDLNGPWVGEASAVLNLEWDGSNWLEIGRR